ncbi:DUF302 domain-containing protein [Paucibacter sp. PLA-PC-4]|nr:DUF302 domain-containing protein [Paucibacter sp. PLA-PC-4]
MQSAMKEKPWAKTPAHHILGACNPPLEHQAFQPVPDIGLRLPCKVITSC